VTYDASCHLLYGQRAAEEPLALLRSIPGINFIPLPGSEKCCGAAGVYNLVEREMSQEILTEKLASIKETGADVVVTGNAGCQMQIGAGALLTKKPLKVMHAVELLDESYHQAGLYESA
jgi:glycolate oxidase iron-sulfur subunit